MINKIKNRYSEAFYKQVSAKNIFRFFILLLVFSSFVSCNETKEVGPETLGFDFYPLSIGEYRVYDVEEINYLITGFDTAVYQLREIITDSIRTNDQTTYLLRRDIRVNELEDWESDSVWTVTKTSNYLAITENNIPFIKITFPVKEGKEWDGNSLNSRAEQIYYYQQVDSLLIDSLVVEDQIRVVIEDVEENVTGVDLRSEVYIKGIGLAEKNYLTQKRCTSSDCGPDLGEVIAGRAVRQTLIEIGNEE